jgi:hypothetical protein
MAEQLSDDTQRRIDALVKETCVSAHAADPVALELRGHIEDKILAYINGEQRMTEADAFVLAREHFGDREQLNRVLAEVHVQLAPVIPWRKLSAFLLAFLLTGRLLALFSIPLYKTQYWNLYLVLANLLTLGGLFLLLKHWKAVSDTGIRMWFDRWPLPVLLSLCGVLVAAAPGVDAAKLYLIQLTGGPSDLTTFFLFNYYLQIFVMSALVVSMGLIALWWCGVKLPPFFGQVVRKVRSA